MRRVVFLLVVLVCASAAFGQSTGEGSLYAVGRSGRELGTCPLKNTDVKVEISGFMSRVSVKQEFENSYNQAIEAVYMFPLSQNGAVDRMTMTVGSRVIRGKIMRREEARETYETAKTEGKTASLLDQERPNVFTQSVANIMPGERVVVDISYVETLKYEDGAYEFVFPMTVGQRYIPAGVKDAAKISSPVARTRNGSNISVEVDLNAGVPVEQIRSISHRIDQINVTPSKAKITLAGGKTIPNKDFVLRYDVTGRRIEDAVLTHRDARGGFFTMILQPPDIPAAEDRTPKEIVFVLDTSGSMDGFPIEKAKEAMKLSLDGLYPEDTFNLITFAGDTEILFPQPVPATRSNLDRAHAFIKDRNGNGGTEMMAAIKASLEPSDSQEHLRIVCFMTDGQVGNDDEIVAEVQKHPRARVFSFGIGDSVNRSLLDRIAQEGKGEATYIALEDDGSKAAKKFYERVRTPLLTDLSIDWNGMPVADVLPERLTDLFSAKPVVVSGRYTKPARGTIKLRGLVAGQPYERVVAFDLPESENANDALASVWARTRIGELSNKKLNAASPEIGDAIEKQITGLGLEFGLMSEFTSFVAVEERVVNQNGKPTTVIVPLERPAASPADEEVEIVAQHGLTAPPAASQGNRKFQKQFASRSNGVGSGSGTGRGSGRGTGAGYGSGGGLGTGNGNGPVSQMVNQPANVDSVTLTVGNASPPPPAAKINNAVSATVEVSGSAQEVVNTTNASLGNTFISRQIQALPLNGRSVSSLLSLRPGTSASENENIFQIDGASQRDLIDMEGRVVLAVKPDGRRGATRMVTVAIETDVFGNVVSANPEGPASLRAVSQNAALLNKFAPVATRSGKPLRLVGTIVYRFTKNGKVEATLRDMKAASPTDADMRLIRLGEKMHFWLSALIQRIESGSRTPGENEAKFVSAGSALVRIKLKERGPASIARLKAAGFEIVRESGRIYVEGRVRVEKLAGLAEIDDVVLITPRI